jgi:hypothetical protein
MSHADSDLWVAWVACLNAALPRRHVARVGTFFSAIHAYADHGYMVPAPR